MRWFGALLFLASVEAARLVGGQCGGEPSSWCGSLRDASSCHALSYCVKEVWEGERLQVKQTKECRFSQKMVETVQQLTKKKGLVTGQAAYLVASMCTVIPDDSLRKQCKDLVTDFMPQISKLMDSAMEPASVAAVLGLCQPLEKRAENRITVLTFEGSRKMAGGTAECDLCKFVVNELDNFLSQNGTEAAIQDFLDDICRKLPSGITPQCLSFVDEYAAMVVKLLIEDELKPQEVCSFLKLCQSSAGKKLTMPSKSAPGMFCTVCEVLVGMLEVQISENATEEDVEKVLDVVCSLFPGNLSSECVSLVSMYLPIIIDLVEQELPPAVICQKIRLCNATAPAGPLKPATFYRKSSDPVKCDLCKVVFTEINQLLGENRSEQAIIHAVEKVCDVVQGDLRLQCKSEVENYGPAVLDLLKHMDNPTQMCTALRLCASAPSQDSSPRHGEGVRGGLGHSGPKETHVP